MVSLLVEKSTCTWWFIELLLEKNRPQVRCNSCSTKSLSRPTVCGLRGQRSEVRGGFTPDVGHAVAGVPGAEGEVGVALLRGGRVLGQELHDVRVVGVTPQAAATDDVHDARQHVAGVAAQRPRTPAPRPS